MLVIRNVFQCKPGQAKALIASMKEMFANNPAMPKARFMTDISAAFWTVVLEIETESLADWDKQNAAAADARKGSQNYMDFVTGGYREIFKVE